MSARITINPHQLDAAKRDKMFRYGPEELLEHPSAFYRAGFDPLAASGRIRPMMDFVLLRAITGVEIHRVESSTIMLAGDADRIGDAQCFEIVEVGPVIKQLQRGRWWRRLRQALGFGPGGMSILGRVGAGVNMVRIHYMNGSVDDLQPGNHCVSVASAADALDPEGDGIFQLVRAVFIPAAWDPAGAAEDVVVALGEAHQKYLAEEAEVVAAAREAQKRHMEVVEERRREEERERHWMLGMPFEGQMPPEGWKPRPRRRQVVDDGAPNAPNIIIPARHRSAG